MVRRAPRRPTGTVVRRQTPNKEIAHRSAESPRPGVGTVQGSNRAVRVTEPIVEGTIVSQTESAIDLDHLEATGEVVRVTETHTRERVEREYEGGEVQAETVDRETKQRVTEFGEGGSGSTPPPGAYYAGPTKPAQLLGDGGYSVGYPVAADGVTPVARALLAGVDGKTPSAREVAKVETIRRKAWESALGGGLGGSGEKLMSVLTFGPMVAIVAILILGVGMMVAVADVWVWLRFVGPMVGVFGAAWWCSWVIDQNKSK